VIDRYLCVLRSEKYRNNCDWNKACFSGGGKYVIAGSATGAVNVWETASGKLVSGTLARPSVCRAVPRGVCVCRVRDVFRLLMTCLLAAEMDEKHPYMIACSTWCPSTSQLITAFRGENTDVALWS
jgi:WD40 repeat protein